MQRIIIDEARKEKLKQRMLSKLNRQSRWSYLPVYLPKGISELALIQGMKNFIENLLDVAIEKSAAVLPRFSEQDSELIGMGEPTVNVLKLYELLSFLENNGFPGPEKFAKPINFYSGKDAQYKAYHISSELSLIEGMIPAFTVIYDLWYAVQDKPQSELIFCTLSRLLASFASGEVNIYLSSNNFGERAGLTAGSYFWDMELPILQNNKRVTAILLHVYDADKKRWKEPVNFHSIDSSDVPIYIKPMEDRYKPDEEISPLHVESKPITLGYMKNILSLWLKPVVVEEKEQEVCATLK